MLAPSYMPVGKCVLSGALQARFAFCLVLIASSIGVTYAEDIEPVSSTNNKELFDIALRYFQYSESFEPGDLIVRSQVADLQSYLRKTRGPCRATDAKLLKRILPDNAPFSRFFYLHSGEKVLRNAASRLGGYRQLVSACNDKQGLIVIKEAIRTGNPEPLVSFVESRADQNSGASSDPKQVNPNSFLDSRIYTVAEFVEAVGGDNVKRETAQSKAATSSS